MTVIALPTGFCPNQFSMRLPPVQRVHSSPFGGSEQVIDLLKDRWVISMTMPNRLHADAARLEAFIAALRGMTNTVDLWHFGRPIPRGTMRGTPTSNAASQGAAAVTLASAGAGASLLAGDLIGIGGLLLQVAADATANGSGVMAVTLANRLRKPITAATAVVWDRPAIPCRLSSGSGVQYVPGYSPEVSLDFVEAIV